MTQRRRTSTPRSPHDSMRAGQVCFTLVHHANQYVITDHLVGRGYVRRDEALHATPPSLAAGAL